MIVNANIKIDLSLLDNDIHCAIRDQVIWEMQAEIKKSMKPIRAAVAKEMEKQQTQLIKQAIETIPTFKIEKVKI